MQLLLEISKALILRCLKFQIELTMSDPALTLALTEITFGNILHAARMPFRGHCLAANQALILSWANQEKSGCQEPIRISCLAGLAKTFSIGVAKIMPALAISTQGLLFAAGLRILGQNVLGRTLGSFLLLLWPSLQRGAFLGGLAYLFGTESMWQFLLFSGLALLLATLPVAIGITFVASRYDLQPYMRLLHRYQAGSKQKVHGKGQASIWKRAWRDLRSLPVLIACAAHLACCWWDGFGLGFTTLRSAGLLIGIYVLLLAQHLFLTSLRAERLAQRLPSSWRDSLQTLREDLQKS